MKSLLILFLVISMGCYSQSSQEKFTYKKQRELKPPFETQGEQEDYWSQEFFKKQYENCQQFDNLKRIQSTRC